MPTLQRLLSTHALGALCAREHVRVAPGSVDALRDELEAVIAPMLPSITPYLMAAHLPLASAHDGFGDRNADEAVAVMIDALGDRLAHSNHVDDIYASDGRIRRDALRAAREVLVRYMRGELEIEDDAPADDGWTVALDSLGYLVVAAAGAAPEALMDRALAAAARRARVELVSYEPARRVAVFRGKGLGLLAIEEAVAGQLARLCDAGRIELPAVEQIVALPAGIAARAGLDQALAAAALGVQSRLRCMASCVRESPRQVRVALTPLSVDVAQRAEEHFEELLAAVQAALEAAHERPDAGAPDSTERVIARARMPEPISSRRQPRDKAVTARGRASARKRQRRAR